MLPTIFAGIAIVQFFLACVVFASLVYFVIRDYIELQQRRRQLRALNGMWRHSTSASAVAFSLNSMVLLLLNKMLLYDGTAGDVYAADNCIT